MASGDENRLVAWNRELEAVHQRLREALRIAREEIAAGHGADAAASASANLLLYCHGFCAALGGHHAGEDGALFPELAERHPELRPVIAKLEQDHAMIGSLLAQFQRAIDSGAAPEVLSSHLEGIAAIMESHFRFEERQLLEPLAKLDLDADPRTVFGPL
ncbi:hemerythrin domain-containing protein [Actinomadura sp. WMMB 499]|uniref:hemerythrin domain-containing protein n=1 Tax=Actinomadura sp. WMMB 499 TaxID=1219491 RepID=UPI001247A1BE|nr:hemerythrin domain-containing protein [Actinomadura sp. WMMB 499]QFG24400.1 hemerythrin domain-containing protein [Actinomadura sp. WMMB 499]